MVEQILKLHLLKLYTNAKIVTLKRINKESEQYFLLTQIIRTFLWQYRDRLVLKLSFYQVLEKMKKKNIKMHHD